MFLDHELLMLTLFLECCEYVTLSSGVKDSMGH